MTKLSSRAWLAAAMVTAALGGAGWYAAEGSRERTPAPVLGSIPQFSMHDQTGTPISSESLRGQVLVIDFFFATCTTSCPRLNRQLNQLRQDLHHRSLPIHFVSITLDPANDTPEVLRDYAQQFGAGPEEWSFLSGRDEDLNRVVIDGFKMHFQRPDPTLGLATIMHGEWFVLVDTRSRVRGYYQSGDPERMRELETDAEQLAMRKDDV